MTVISPTVLRIMDSTRPTRSAPSYSPNTFYVHPAHPNHRVYELPLPPQPQHPFIHAPYQRAPQPVMPQLSQPHPQFAHQYSPHLLMPHGQPYIPHNHQPQSLPGGQNIRPRNPSNVTPTAHTQPARMRPNPELRPGGKMFNSNCYFILMLVYSVQFSG